MDKNILLVTLFDDKINFSVKCKTLSKSKLTVTCIYRPVHMYMHMHTFKKK